MAGKKIVSIGEVLNHYLKTAPIGSKIKRFQIFDIWPDIVGKTIARNTKPERIERKMLVIHVQNSVWRHELLLRKKEIVKRINDYYQEEIVNDLIFR